MQRMQFFYIIWWSEPVRYIWIYRRGMWMVFFSIYHCEGPLYPKLPHFSNYIPMCNFILFSSEKFFYFFLICPVRSWASRPRLPNWVLIFLFKCIEKSDSWTQTSQRAIFFSMLNYIYEIYFCFSFVFILKVTLVIIIFIYVQNLIFYSCLTTLNYLTKKFNSKINFKNTIDWLMKRTKHGDNDNTKTKY